MTIWIINLFSDLPNEGAAEGRFLTLSKHFAAQGHRVVWFTMDFHHRTKKKRGSAHFSYAQQLLDEEAGKGAIKLQPIPVPEYRMNISLRRFYSHRKFASKLLELSKKSIPADPTSANMEAPSLIIASSPPLEAARAAIKLGRHYSCPAVIDLTDLWPNTFERIIPLPLKYRKILGKIVFYPLYAQAKSVYRKADKISAVSAEYLAEVRTISPKQKTHLCYIGGEILNPPALETRVENSKTRFIYLGAMTDSYDLLTIIDAAQHLRKASRTNFEIHFAGSGPNEANLKQHVLDLDLGSFIHFHGFLNAEAMNSLLKECDVGLNCIHNGLAITMPHKLSDYLCASLPVINSLDGESAELLAKHQCGQAYHTRKPASLATAIEHYLNPTQLIKEKRNAHYLALDLLDRQKTYSTWAEWITKG